MSQVAAKKKVDLRNERVKVTALFNEQGSVLKGDQQGNCDGFHLEFSVDSDEMVEEIAELIRLAHQMCFTEAALSQKVQLTMKHVLNGAPLASETA